MAKEKTKKLRTIAECRRIVEERGEKLQLDSSYIESEYAARIWFGGDQVDIPLGVNEDGDERFWLSNKKIVANKAADFAIKYLKKQRKK